MLHTPGTGRKTYDRPMLCKAEGSTSTMPQVAFQYLRSRIDQAFDCCVKAWAAVAIVLRSATIAAWLPEAACDTWNAVA